MVSLITINNKEQKKKMPGSAQHILNPQHVIDAAHKALNAGLYDESWLMVETLLAQGLVDPEIQLLAGISKYYQGQYEDALAYFSPLLKLMPDYTEVHYFKASCHLKLNHAERAIEHFNEAYRLDPVSMVEALMGLGLAYAQLKDFGNAKTYFLNALKTSPSMPSLWYEYGNFLRKFQKIEEAQQIHELATIKEDGFLPTAHANNLYNLAQYLIHAEDYLGAEKLLGELLKAYPGEPNSIWSLANIACLSGDFETGLYLFESRWEISGGHPTKRDLRFKPQDEYCGQDLKDKTLLIMAEQGIGDFLMHGTCIQDAIDQAGHVVIETPFKLVGLMYRAFPEATIMPVEETKFDPYKTYYGYSWLSEAPQFDYYCGIGSLAKHFRKTLTDFGDGHYLKADLRLSVKWKDKLAELGEGLKIGVCFRGGVSEGTRIKSYTEIAEWRDVFDDDVKLVNLVYDLKPEEKNNFKDLAGYELHHFDELNLFDDLDSTAALIENLDLVISIASTNVELAGALGTKAIRLTSRPDWTMMGTGHRPWFKSQEIISKKYFDTWTPVMGQLKSNL